MAVRVQITIIRRIPDSSSRITDSKSHDFAFHKQIVSLVPVSRIHTYMEGNNSYKQTNKNNYFIWSRPVDRSHTIRSIRQFRYLPDDEKIDSENIDVLLLENVKEQKSKNEIPKGTRLGKTEQDIAFR